MSEDLREGIGHSADTDYFRIEEQLSDDQIAVLLRTREFVEGEVLPVINDHWERADFPRDLARRMGELGLVGDGIEGYGCPDLDPMQVGLINMEVNRGDGSLGTFLGVQAGLAMRAISELGSEEQKQEWLPRMATCELLGAFALTEPDHGSDSIALETTARRDGDDWVLNGHKKWIGNGTVADVVVVWARDTDDEQVKGFLVRRPEAEGYDARVIEGKASLRAVWQAEITLTDVRVPERDRLPGAEGFGDCGAVLAGTRSACAWMALGHAVAGYDTALEYAGRREQFGRPLASFQIVQQRLVQMLADVTAMQLYCLQIGHLAERGALPPTLSGLAKLHNTTKARSVLATARDLLGGNGILLDYHVMRHMSDIESIHTFEGTETIQTLIVGRDITGVGAFA